MSDRNIADCDPAFRPVVQQIIDAAKTVHIDARPIVTWRDAADQNHAETSGKSKAHFGESPHNCVDSQANPAARAFDFGIFDNIDGRDVYISDGTDPRYAQIGAIAVSLGCVWGGNWTPEREGCRPDFDHIEMADWKNQSTV